MDKKVAFSIAATAISLAVSMDVSAASTPIASSGAPTAVVVSPAGPTASYVTSQFSFTPSANVALNYDVAASTNVNGDTAVVTSANTTKGTRSFAGAIGVTSSSPRACQTTDLTGTAVTPGTPTVAVASACTN